MANKSEWYSQISADYSQKRAAQEEALSGRLAEIRARIPAYKEISDAITDACADRAMAVISGDTARAASLDATIKDLTEQKQVLLLSAGFPDGYDRLRYYCDKCRDTGFSGGKRCSCFKQKLAEILSASSGIKDILERENFDTFSFEYFDKNTADPNTGRSSYDIMLHNYNIAREFVSPFVPGAANLLFTGAAGTGKTFLSNCIAGEVIRQGFSVVYLSAATLFDKLADSAFGRRDSEDRETIYDSDLLVIDDLGTEFNNSFVSSQLFCCINERRLRGRSTIISTNLDLDGIRGDYTERVSSRIAESYRICPFFGTDIRLIKRKNSFSK
ncbi:MAG: ATP-binding protein [Lachnospiraceae bacterium]|nr:ATP-binding protein [Lachnospiraceae bacterium]